MLNGRDKQGSVSVDWASVALGKPRRKSFEFVDDDGQNLTIYIRELGLIRGALGCAVWDGGVILARWIFTHRGLLNGRRILELGSGCALPGIIAARYARYTLLTDYVSEVLENIRYNILLNSNEDETNDLEHGSLSSRTQVSFLDWDEFMSDSRTPKAPKLNCTRFDQVGRGFQVQSWFYCRTCFADSTTEGVCAYCKDACHSGHQTVEAETSRFSCDCGKSDACRIARERPIFDPASAPTFDVILGSELTYSLLSVQALAATVDALLAKPHGVFYEVLSDDRDGVAAFLGEMRLRGFVCHQHPVSARYLGNYGTRDWTYQDRETYSFYTFYRQADDLVPFVAR